MKSSDDVYAVSDFTNELVADVKADGYSLRAWQTFLARSWAQSIDDIRVSPGRVRSLLRWSAVGAVIGTAIIGATFAVQDSGTAIRAGALWFPWYASTIFFVFTHLGMLDDAQGEPRTELLLPNGLSFLRLGLAPLVLWPCLSIPTHPSTTPVFAVTVVLLGLTDALDGSIARRLGVETRIGRMLDPLADVSFLGFLVVGLFAAGALPTPLLVLLLLRYPGALAGVVVLYFLRGPAPLRPTVIIRATSLVTNALLIGLALALLLRPEWLQADWVDWPLGVLYVLGGANLVHLAYRAVTWPAPASAMRLRAYLLVLASLVFLNCAA